MSVWSKQEHNVDQGRGSPDTKVEVDTQGGGQPAALAARTLHVSRQPMGSCSV